MSGLRRLAKGCGFTVATVVGLLVVALGVVVVVARVVGPPKPGPPPRTAAERTARNLKIFDAAWGDIDRHYYDPSFHGLNWSALKDAFRPRAAAAVSDADLYINVLGNMTGRLGDSHTSVVAGTNVWPARGHASINAGCARPPDQIDMGFWPGRSWSPDAVNVVADLRKGSAADGAGLEPGSEIARWTWNAPACGSARIDLDILPAGSAPAHHVSYTVEPTRPEPSHEAYTLADGVRVLRFNAFDNGNGAWLLAELRSAPKAGVILDLRHNGGGTSQVLEVIAGAVVGPGQLLGTWIDAHGRHAQRSRQLNLLDRLLLSDHTTPNAFRYSGPLVVMVGPASASAAEILAQCLHFNHRAFLIGERTGGQVEVAQRFWLPDDGVVEVTVADFEDPSGKRLENRGVVPDFFARQTLAAVRAGKDIVVEAADRAMTNVRRS